MEARGDSTVERLDWTAVVAADGENWGVGGGRGEGGREGILNPES